MASPQPQLRRLVACPDCGLQYDASGRAPGARFHCACGSVVTIGAERPHDAAVVRCAACGGARRHGALACTFCGADFTLHEQDLQTVCPGCLTRISDRARYCHACGLAIVPQGPIGSLSGKLCPVCGAGHELRVRNLEEGTVTVLECERCAGVWVGQRIFGLLESRARQSVEHWGEAPPPKPAPPSGQPGPTFYRACVECGKLMNRRNYGQRSGIIVDVCRAHGLWFDVGELEDILAWVRGGGLAEAEARALAAAQEKRSSGGSLPADWRAPQADDPTTWRGFVTNLIDALVDFLTAR